MSAAIDEINEVTRRAYRPAPKPADTALGRLFAKNQRERRIDEAVRWAVGQRWFDWLRSTGKGLSPRAAESLAHLSAQQIRAEYRRIAEREEGRA